MLYIDEISTQISKSDKLVGGTSKTGDVCFRVVQTRKPSEKYTIATSFYLLWNFK